MEFLSEDPTYLAGGLGILAVLFLAALKLTQQGKFLVWSVVSLALALLVMGVEQIWVTDNERIEGTVYELGRAVKNSDVNGVLDRLAPDVQYVAGGNSQSAEITRTLIKSRVGGSRFDYLTISHLKVSGVGQARRGRADFHVLCGGNAGGVPFASIATAWSLGFREMSPGVWKVYRITPVSIPGRQSALPMGFLDPDSELDPPHVAPTDSPFRGQAHHHRMRRFGRRSALARLNIPNELPPPMEP